MTKKNFFLYFLFLIIFFPVISVNSLSFPSKIKPSRLSVFGNYGWNIYKKSYIAPGASGKVFCTTFWREAPSGGECNAVNWVSGLVDNNGTNLNIKASAAVGTIIDSFRSSDGSMTWDNYFYAELAINQFLYETKNLGTSSNNISNIPKTIYNKIRKYVDKASAVYTNYYNHDVVTVSDMKLNGKSITGGRITVNESNNYIIKATLKCYDTNNKNNQITCDLPRVRSITVNGNIINNYTTSVTSSGKNSIVNIDVTNYVKNNSNSSLNFNIVFSNKRKYKYAQRYNCGNDYQSLTPNYLSVDYSRIKTSSTSFKLTKENSTSKSCEEQLTNNPKENYKLYATYKKEGLLDINNPSCDNFDFSNVSLCENTLLTNEWVENVGFGNLSRNNFKDQSVYHSPNGQNYSVYSALTKANMIFDNLVYENNTASSGTLLFSPKENDSNLFGKAIINYQADIPELYEESFENMLIIKVDELIPSLFVEINGERTEIIGEFKSATGSAKGEEKCIVSDDRKEIRCPNYSGSAFGFGWKVTVEIDYKYSDANKYMVSSDDGSIVPWTAGNDVYGYGILISNSAEETDDGKAKIIFVSKKGKGTIFSVNNKNITNNNGDEVNLSNAFCNYVISNDDVRTQLKYRTIDINNAFNKSNGQPRYTGKNWCEYNDTNNSTDISDTDKNHEWDVGDINMDHNINSDDIILLRIFLAGNVNLDENQKRLADYNSDGTVNSEDLTTLENFLKSNTDSLDVIVVDETHEWNIGDVNMDHNIDNSDLDIVSSYLAYLIQLNDIQIQLADFDRNGIVNVNDYATLQNYIVKMSNSEATLSGSYSTEENKNNSSLIGKCSPDNSVVKKYIKNRPNSNGKKPLYSFKLDAKTIKDIRNDNKIYKYGDNNSSKSASEYLKKLYEKTIDSNSLCYSQINENGFCNVDKVLERSGLIKEET